MQIHAHRNGETQPNKLMLKMPTQSQQHDGLVRPLKYQICAYFLFFISGFCALLYEVVWSRMLVLVMGNTVFATTTVLTVFMAGLSLGGLYWGNAVDTTKRNPLFLFGCLEAGIGLSALIISQIIWAIIPVGAWASHIADIGSVAQMVVRFFLCLILLFCPTFLIGGTFAVVGKYIITDKKSFAQRTSGLYGINTIGSFLGAFVTGFFLIKSLGHNGSLIVAALMNCSGGILAVWMSTLRNETTLQTELPPEQKRKIKRKEGRPEVEGIKLVLIGLFISGFCAIAYQILWTRILVLMVDNSVYSFTIILMAFLAGMALGSLILNRLIRFISSPVPVFALVQICIGISAFCFPFTIHLKSKGGPDTYYYDFLFSALPLSILLPTILMGIAFPLGAQIYHRYKTDIGKSLGVVYFINTAGCVFGGLSTGFFLIGRLGFQKSTFILSGLNQIGRAHV
jgi:spermidine synthase